MTSLPILKISFIVIPMFEAVEDEVPHTKWAEKICVLIPASSKSLFKYLAMVLDVTALCGLIMVAMESFVTSPQIRAVCASYACSVSTGHNSCSLEINGRHHLCSSLVLTVLPTLQV